jgi:hypothetical protein
MIDAEALALWTLAATHGVTRLRELARMTGRAPHALQAGLQGLRRQGYAACEGRAWQMTPRGILLARVAGRIGGAESATTPWSLNTAIVAEGILTMLAAELPTTPGPRIAADFDELARQLGRSGTIPDGTSLVGLTLFLLRTYSLVPRG